MSWSWTGDESKWSEAQKLDSLEPGFRSRIESVMATLRGQGYAPFLFYGWRNTATQADLLARGLTSVSFSFHNALNDQGQPASLAVDIADGRRDSKGRMISWGAPWPGEPNGSTYSKERNDKAQAFFRALGAAGKAVGLYWGGDWRKPDPAHLQAQDNSTLGAVKKRSMAVLAKGGAFAAASASNVVQAAQLTLTDPGAGALLLQETARRFPWWGWAAVGGLGLVGVLLAVRSRRRS